MPRYTIAGDPQAFHADPTCARLNPDSDPAKRSEQYIAFHDLDPCPNCHPDLHKPNQTITPERCRTIRASDATPSTLADRFGVSTETIHRHANGACACEVDG